VDNDSARPAAITSREIYSTNNNTSQHLHLLPYHHHHHHHQQQQQRWVEMREKDEMRRKLAQWCEWRRRYGILSSFYIGEQLR